MSWREMLRPPEITTQVISIFHSVFDFHSISQHHQRNRLQSCNMTYIHSIPSSLEQLPLEVRYAIVDLLGVDSRKHLALANHRIRNICIPILFRCVSFDFSSAGFDAMRQLAASRLACYVKSFRYYYAPCHLRSCTTPRLTCHQTD